ncbi:MAG: flagellar biosynthesis protein FlhB [Asticcacaulis sp. 32-58-5]|nr:MAG: flagellar biosynthesis protein FlhB [Asticcacaulis sp. 32-58-5]
MAEGSDEDKTEEASAKKLEDARRRGEVAKTPDLPQVLALIGTCAVIAIYGESICRSLIESLLPFVAMPHALVKNLDNGGGVDIARHVILIVLPVVGLAMAGAFVLGIAGNLLQTGLMFSTESLKPTFDKLDPIKGFNRLFGIDALVQFLKTFVKVIVTGWIVWAVLKPKLMDIPMLAGGSPVLIFPYARDVLIVLTAAVCVFLALGAGLDFLWQKYRFAQKMKMSRTEQKDEYKQTEGDPHVKARLRQIRMEKGRQRMMANVATATVVVTNPTHYAVALRYDAEDTPAPMCVAKGVDAVALRIREEAAKHDIMIVEDPPLARALYAAVDLDEIIPEDHFVAVAKLIGFVMARKKRGF